MLWKIIKEQRNDHGKTYVTCCRKSSYFSIFTLMWVKHCSRIKSTHIPRNRKTTQINTDLSLSTPKFSLRTLSLTLAILKTKNEPERGVEMNLRILCPLYPHSLIHRNAPTSHHIKIVKISIFKARLSGFVLSSVLYTSETRMFVLLRSKTALPGKIYYFSSNLFQNVFIEYWIKHPI